MRYRILLSTVSCFCFFLSSAQQNNNRAFAIVNSNTGNLEWTNIREIDLSTGKVTRDVFTRQSSAFAMVDANTQKTINQKTGLNQKLAPLYEHPTATMVAAAAFDKRHNKLYFTPMRYAELRWIDLYDKSSTVKVYCLPNQLLSDADSRKEGSQVTRMVISADGNGYALTNDGQLSRFTTGKKTVVTQLGMLKDDPSNNDKSISKREHMGGDMIADAFNHLYVFAANGAIFKIDIKSLIATYLGNIKGLPQQFTTNGAAVDNNGDIIVSNAYTRQGYFKVNMETLEAEKVEYNNEIYPSSDLASGNLAFQKLLNQLNAPTSPSAITMLDKNISLYPNPVTTSSFRLKFQNSEKGKYEVQLVDLSGKIILREDINLSSGNQTENILVDRRLSKGIYMIKIMNNSKKLVSSGNIVLQ